MRANIALTPFSGQLDLPFLPPPPPSLSLSSFLLFCCLRSSCLPPLSLLSLRHSTLLRSTPLCTVPHPPCHRRRYTFLSLFLTAQHRTHPDPAEERQLHRNTRDCVPIRLYACTRLRIHGAVSRRRLQLDARVRARSPTTDVACSSARLATLFNA